MSKTSRVSKVAGREFPALEAIVNIHKALAAIFVVLGLLGTAFTASNDRFTGLAVVVAFVSSILVPLFLWGTAELILLILKIERNTWRIGELLAGMENRKS